MNIRQTKIKITKQSQMNLDQKDAFKFFTNYLYGTTLHPVMKSENWSHWIPDVTVPSSTDVQNSVIQFNVDRLNNILEISHQKLRENPEFENKQISVTSEIKFGPFRISATIKD